MSRRRSRRCDLARGRRWRADRRWSHERPLRSRRRREDGLNRGSSLPRDALRFAFGTIGLIVALSLVVRAVGAAPPVRELLGFSFDAPPREPGEALALAATNLRLAAAALLAAALVRTRPDLRMFLDATLGGLLAFNIAGAASALGAYGTRLLIDVGVHAALELMAFSLAGGVYFAARRRELDGRRLAGAAACCAWLLADAALVETYLQLGSGQ